ncbi:MAG: DUF1329 domain-containing protein [Gammaproteobacteria bacterium]|jgi:hypothetical protein|nr:DUF1329 domain-containing protein [Gammaproteobacteria bacterium]
MSGKYLKAISRALLLTGVVFSSGASADSDLSYQTLRDWISSSANGADHLTPGQHLSYADREIIESLVPQAAWKYYIFEDMDMEVAATGTYPPPSDWGQKKRDDYYLDDQAVLINFAGGGFPFPEIGGDDPIAAQKVIWNMLWRPGQQDFNMPMVAWLRSEHGKLDRVFEFASVSATYAQGKDPLVPGYEEVKSKSIMEFRSPRDMAGTKSMTIEYIDHYKEDSGWMYLPSQRKPRRTLSSERTAESAMGMDNIKEDGLGFSGKIYENNWTYLGKRPVLATINVRDNAEWGGPHLWVPHKARWEVRDSHVILIEPKADNHPYSYRIVFIDAETYWTHWMFGFDRSDDQVLRMSQHVLKYSESYKTESAQQAPFVKQDFSQNLSHNVFLHLGETDINTKKPHATQINCYVQKRAFSPARAKQFFSLRNMTSGRR